MAVRPNYLTSRLVFDPLGLASTYPYACHLLEPPRVTLACRLPPHVVPSASACSDEPSPSSIYVRPHACAPRPLQPSFDTRTASCYPAPRPLNLRRRAVNFPPSPSMLRTRLPHPRTLDATAGLARTPSGHIARAVDPPSSGAYPRLHRRALFTPPRHPYDQQQSPLHAPIAAVPSSRHSHPAPHSSATQSGTERERS